MTGPDRHVTSRGEVVWGRDPFRSGTNPRPWVVVASARLPYPSRDSLAVACTTSSHHASAVRIPSGAWVAGDPNRESHVLPWTVTTLRDGEDVVGVQGRVRNQFVERLVDDLCAVLGRPPET
ncbi:hypothetical protein RYH80_07210 [Halobaculum sp. MBLA0147]|uniref:hypothetical protein n=1 Tax=Halobaculum sp. MBLA0147 TaxID=3079934 RepID=UPI003523EC7D